MMASNASAAELNVIYEEDFLGFSYGFRPGRSQHDALDALIVGISSRKVNFILDANIRSFFTEVSQEWVVRFLEHRIGDKRILRLVQKWLRAGVLEDGAVTIEDRGTGQGSVISPLLANVYLHYVFDLWAERWRRVWLVYWLLTVDSVRGRAIASSRARSSSPIEISITRRGTCHQCSGV